jgi:hypothetical protein
LSQIKYSFWQEIFFQKRQTVEKYNEDKINKLKWECPDVLFSFRGVYAIGVFIEMLILEMKGMLTLMWMEMAGK